MLKQISDNWWMLQYDDGYESRCVWFGQTEGQVKQKFASWMSRASLGRLMRCTKNPGAGYDGYDDGFESNRSV